MSELYTSSDYARMHLIYGECEGDAKRAAEVYRERFPNAKHPDHRVFTSVHNAFIEGRIPGTSIEPEHSEDDDLEESIARPTGVSGRNEHKYNYRLIQCLLPRDCSARVKFCKNMLSQLKNDPEFFYKILWSNEVTCGENGYFNMHYLNSFQFTDPLTEEDSSEYEINFWTGILNGKVIGPFELPETLTAESYLAFLRQDLPTLLEDVSLTDRSRMWLQHDDCPAHNSRSIRDHLDEMYPQRWIGRFGTIVWPQRSPDLNPLDFFYWKSVKDMVYEDPITSVEQIRERVQIAAQKITKMKHASKLKRSFILRCEACITANGGRFDHFL
ncbi:unnamed protein product [Colias eurytheme]|nr:unnamed protein product [Colias eurytheme]